MFSAEKNCEDCKNNLATTCHYVGLIQNKNLQLVLLLPHVNLKENLL